MGLDICISQMQKIDTSRLWTEKEVYGTFDPDGKRGSYLYNIVPVKGHEDFTIEGADGYLFKCVVEMYDTAKMMEKLGIRKEDGWEEDGSSSCACHTPEENQPTEDKVGWWFSFVNKHGSDNYDDWEFKEIPDMVDSDEFIKPTEYWCILTIGEDLADMRKGANARFYDDGQWDDNFCPVCSKRVLEEHMNKYFDESGDAYYDTKPYFGNAKAAFKEMIFNHFEDDKGLCVVYV